MVCCVCLLEHSEVINIFNNLHLKNDSLTSQICSNCWHKIYDFHQFHETVERAHRAFKKEQPSIKEENLSLINIKKEDEDDYFENNLQQVEIEIHDTKISEFVELQTNLKNPLDDGVESEKMSNLENEDDSEEYAISEINDLDYEPEKMKAKCVKVHNTKIKKGIKKKVSRKYDRKTNTDTLKKKRISHRLDTSLTDEIIKKHIQMTCNLCIYVGKTFSDIMEHFKNHHENIKAYIMCCDKKFTRPYCIAQHAYIHENPNSFSCKECKKSFTTSYGLRIHNISYHASEEERTHACEHCPRKFGRRNLLELHKQTHIPKEQWTIVCTKCTTRTAKFATQYLLNIHTSMYHRREINICQVCAKEIKDKKAFEKHVRSHFEDSGPRLKCPIENCESWLKDEDNLKTHIQRYHLDDKTYKCPDCDKVCRNRRSLSSHKHYFHSKEIFRCEQCDKTFKKALTLKEHMTQHTGETLYNCPFCTRTFNSNANMHSHKKKQHPIEWEELRRKKLGPLPN